MILKIRIISYCLPLLLLGSLKADAQQVTQSNDSLVVSTRESTVAVNLKTGRLSYHFSNGVVLYNTIAYVNDLKAGYLSTSGCKVHQVTTDNFENGGGKGTRIVIKHSGNDKGITLIQQVTLYQDHDYLLTNLTAVKADGRSDQLESREICALAVAPSEQGSLFQPGAEPRFLDVPFDNDDWVNVLERKWEGADKPVFSGISYEYASIYDNTKLSGLVMGSLSHDFWKTGITYRSGKQTGVIDSLKIYDGAATEDNHSLQADYGGLDGTHDHAPHGTMKGNMVSSSIIYLCGSDDVRKAFVEYGNANVLFNGKQTWKGSAPVCWNSFGVEGVLGYSGVMMPKDVAKISDFIQTLDNLNKYSKPVMSIDSYDQSIYTTDLLASLGRYAKKKNQQMGFYFIPFAMWTWKNSLETTRIAGSDYPLSEVVLRDKNNQPIWYKDGDWGALAMDPTHPAVRLYIINQLEKAKAIGAKFIKIDFLTAGALESTSRFDPNVRSGLQAYNYGMKMLRSLVDTIMGPDVFITMAISPMFPSQYAHTRFVSTDVYSHLRDDQPGFPHYGSTESSLATGSHMWWVQGTLWPYTNMDVSIMKNFQKNPDLTEQEIKVRIYAMMSMGSILGDGSDFRNKIAADRARVFLNNKDICAFFSDPKAFTPLKFSDGVSFDQQLTFYLPGDTTLLSIFNFDREKKFSPVFTAKELGLANQKYIIKDFLTDAVLGQIEAGQPSFTLNIEKKDALMVKLVPVK
jgi:alpha-galactosidase